MAVLKHPDLLTDCETELEAVVEARRIARQYFANGIPQEQVLVEVVSPSGEVVELLFGSDLAVDGYLEILERWIEQKK